MARRIEELRESRHLSRDEVAKKLGTTRMRIWRLENGVTDPSAEDVILFAEIFGVPVASLYRGAKAS